MAVLNLRKVPDELAAALKAEAAIAQMGYHEYCLHLLGWAMGVAKNRAAAIALTVKLKQYVALKKEIAKLDTEIEAAGGKDENRDTAIRGRDDGDHIEAGEFGGNSGLGESVGVNDHEPRQEGLGATGKAFMDVPEGGGVDARRYDDGREPVVHTERLSGKKIADIGMVGAAEREPGFGGAPALPRGGKAQDGMTVADLQGKLNSLREMPGFQEPNIILKPRSQGLSTLVAARTEKIVPAEDGADYFVHPRSEKNRGESVPPKFLEWSEQRLRELADAEPGGLMACSPELLVEFKERAKTDQATATTLHLAGVTLDREILIRWGLADNYKPQLEEKRDGAQGRGTTGKGRGDRREDAAADPKDNVDAQHVDMSATKPKVNIAALKEICAGNIPPIGHVIAAHESVAKATEKSHKLCLACEAPLELAAGKMACRDEACGMYGRIQKGK